jgi:hypothetical protein
MVGYDTAIMPSFYAKEARVSLNLTCLLQEEELRASADPKYAHFNDDLHVEITAFAPPAEAHARIAYALAEVRKFLVPVCCSHDENCADSWVI